MALDRSKEQMVSSCWNWMVVFIGFSPILIPLAILSSPYFAYKGVKKCMEIQIHKNESVNPGETIPPPTHNGCQN